MSQPVRQTSALAIVSLIAGILGWSLLPLIGSLVAIVTGHLARGEIRRNPALDGNAMAVIGLILGWLAVVGAILFVLVFVLFFGGLVWLGAH